MNFPKLSLINGKQLIDANKLLLLKSQQDVCGCVRDQYNHNVLSIKFSSEFANTAFWLNEDYNWVIGTNSEGKILLVPTLK